MSNENKDSVKVGDKINYDDLKFKFFDDNGEVKEATGKDIFADQKVEFVFVLILFYLFIYLFIFYQFHFIFNFN